MYDANKERVAVEIRNASKTGEVVSTASQEKRPLQEASNEGWRVEQSTVQPTFEIGWDWCDQTIPPLTLCWPVEGLRWRILGLGEDAARWTRAPIFLSPKNVEGHDAQLEIQVPSCATLKVNEQSWPPNVLDRCAVGSGISLSLLPYGEVVSVSIDDEEPTPAVIKSDRPLISPPEVLCDDDSVLVTWTATTAYSDLVLLAWNPRDVNAEPKQFPATDVGVKIPCAELPGPICSLAVARRVRVGFTRNVLQLAGLESDPAQLQSVILNVADGKTTEPSLDIPATWTDFLHLLTLSRLNGSLPGALQIHEWLKVLEGDSPPTLEELLNLDEALNKCDSPFESDWRVAVHQFLTDQITNAISKNPSRVFASETGDGDELLKRLFRLGIPIGQHCPFKWLRDVPDPIATHDTVYPFSFMRDLWLLGTRAVAELFGGGAKTNGSNPSLDDICTEAAERVRNFLNKHDLRFLLELLPMRRGTAFVNSEEGHKHSFSFTCPNIDNVHDFLELLGWDNKGIDCDATADDQFWRLQGSNNDRTYRHPDAIRIMAPQRRREWQLKYSLYWDHEEMQWYIERPVEPLPTCCSAEILHVAKFSIDEVIERLDLQQKLNQGANVTGDRTSNQEPVSVPELFTRLLRDDPVTGQLHERLLAALGDTPKVAWQIAWMERLCAWNLLRNVSSNDKSVVQRKLLELLIKMCDCWPELMRRCLATVEFLIWTLYRGGLGIAMRFASDDDVR
ncbi:MAG: hypothetical protein KatS3mg105_2213 [Gemmatales bacterium]|nr:MAG: hypothetical protein KatS3mg105_2213 [Gemmatales bacterium]